MSTIILFLNMSVLDVQKNIMFSINIIFCKRWIDRVLSVQYYFLKKNVYLILFRRVIINNVKQNVCIKKFCINFMKITYDYENDIWIISTIIIKYYFVITVS